MRTFLNKGISPITRKITTITAVRYLGWGVVESLIPLFLFSLVGDFAETGLLKSVYGIVFFISLPIIGEIADHASLKKMVLFGLSIYFLISGSYFFAATTGSLLLVIIARALNGVSYAVDNTARETAFLRYGKHAGKAFAFFETVVSFWWLIAVVISLFVAPYVHIKWLFLGIGVTNLFAFLIALKLPKMKEKESRKLPSLKKMFGSIIHFRALKHFKKKDRFPVLLTTIVQSFVISLPTTYLAIFSYLESADVHGAILIAGLGALPGIMSMFIGRSSDVAPRRSMIFGLVLLALSFVIFAFAGSLVMQLFVAFIAGISSEMIYLSSMVLVKKSTQSDYFGKVDSTLTALSSLVDILGVVAIGFLIDSINSTFLGLGIAFVLGIAVLILLLWWGFVKKN